MVLPEKLVRSGLCISSKRHGASNEKSWIFSCHEWTISKRFLGESTKNNHSAFKEKLEERLIFFLDWCFQHFIPNYFWGLIGCYSLNLGTLLFIWELSFKIQQKTIESTEIRIQVCWVRSARSTSVLYRPPFIFTIKSTFIYWFHHDKPTHHELL